MSDEHDDLMDDEMPEVLGIAPTGETMVHIPAAMSAGYTYDGTKGLDLFETSKKLDSFDEKALYPEYETEFLDNELAQYLVTTLVGNLLDFRFESEDDTAIETVENLMYLRNTEEQLEQMLMNAFVFGTGFLQRYQVGKRVDNITRIDAATIEIEKLGSNSKGELEYIYLQTDDSDDDKGGGKQTKLDNKRLAVFRPIEVPNSAYGISYMRSSLLPLQAIRQLNMDIPAGLKRLLYESMVLYLDLEGVDPNKQKAAIRQATKSFVKYDSATATVIGLDARHKLAYVGSEGGSSARVMPVLDFIEPLLIFLLNKWFVPLGDVLQEKSNRALSETQTETARRRLRTLKRKFARFVEKEIVAHILSGEVGEEPPVVRVVHNVSFGDIKDEVTVLLEGYKVGAVSRQSVQKKLGLFESTDATYYVPGIGFIDSKFKPLLEPKPDEGETSENDDTTNGDDSEDS